MLYTTAFGQGGLGGVCILRQQHHLNIFQRSGLTKYENSFNLQVFLRVKKKIENVEKRVYESQTVQQTPARSSLRFGQMRKV